MVLMRWEPLGQLNTLFEETAPGNRTPSGRRWIPAIDLIDTEDHFVLRADLPGLSEGDVNIEVEGSVLTISGERRAEHEDDYSGYYRLERASGSFARSLTLPEGVSAEGITANFDRGVLEVRVPKPERSKPRKVAITVGGAEQRTIEEGSGSDE
jgi:HSP20 family protein